MAIATAARASGRGRQSVTVEQQRDFREELTAHVAESREYTERVTAIGLALATNPILSRQSIVNLGGELVHRSTRRLAQLGSVTL